MMALEGIRVVEVGSYIAGPVVGTLLADMGAEVIHVERPKTGDESRYTWPTEFRMLNRNTKSVSLDLTVPKGQQLFLGLVKKSDIVIENLTPGSMKTFNCDYSALSQANPRIIMLSISGYGQTGPYRSRPAFNATIQAVGGLMSLTGFPNGPPLVVPNHVADHFAGLFGVYGVLSALFARTRTGKGQHIDVSMMDSLVFTAGDLIVKYLETGEKPVRSGSKLSQGSLAGAYQASDGWVVLTAHGRLWKFVAETMTRQDLAALSPGLEGPPTPALIEAEKALALWVKERTVAEVTEALGKAGAPCVPVMTIDQLAQNEQVISRQMVVDVKSGDSASKVVGIVPKLSATPGSIRSPAQRLGASNYEVYHELLGLERRELDELASTGVI